MGHSNSLRCVNQSFGCLDRIDICEILLYYKAPSPSCMVPTVKENHTFWSFIAAGIKGKTSKWDTSSCDSRGFPLFGGIATPFLTGSEGKSPYQHRWWKAYRGFNPPLLMQIWRLQRCWAGSRVSVCGSMRAVSRPSQLSCQMPVTTATSMSAPPPVPQSPAAARLQFQTG